MNNHIVFLPKWYPSPVDEQFGVFVRKHALAVSSFSKVSVAYTFSGSKWNTSVIRNGNLLEVLVEYPSGFNFMKAQAMALKIIEEENGAPTLLHVHVAGRNAWAALKSKVPYVVTEHWTGFLSGKFDHLPFYKRFFLKFIYRKAAAITVVSPSLQKAMQAKEIKGNYSVIPNVVDVPEFQSKVPSSKNILLTVADLLDSQKNVSGVIRAFGSIKDKFPDCEYHIIGGGPDEAMLKSLARNVDPSGSRIVFHGKQNNAHVYEWLQKASFVVVNSWVETFSVVAAEALACGKPVIVTRSGGPEYFIDERFGKIIEPGDESALVESISFMLNNYTSFDPIAMQSHITEKFSLPIIAKEFQRLYFKVLSSKF